MCNRKRFLTNITFLRARIIKIETKLYIKTTSGNLIIMSLCYFIVMKHVYINTDVNLNENKKTLTLQCIH